MKGIRLNLAQAVVAVHDRPTPMPYHSPREVCTLGAGAVAGDGVRYGVHGGVVGRLVVNDDDGTFGDASPDSPDGGTERWT